ncbi:MAG: hypothetical protein LAT68_04245 [Cyclobacteriaceae bacterium]|nr:hypothetical protein [Cyclobacteriaceae bacterium]MCH8515520.1 hypothetical protein [Cyclobacteriaceae bacterium]
MKKILFAYTITLLFSFTASASENLPIGARARAVGNASSTIVDPWAAFFNVGATGRLTDASVIFGYENRFGFAAFNTVAAGLVYPISDRIGVASITLSTFGDELYSESMLGFGFSNQFGIVSLGAKINYAQYSIDYFGNTGSFLFEFGGVAELTPQLFIGAHIFNLHQAQVLEFNDERLPTIMKSGISYRPTGNVMFNLEAEKDIDRPATVKAGIEYQVIENLFIRTGINTEPFNNFFGIGFNMRGITIDYSYGNNTYLGDVHNFSLNYRFKKN